MKKRSIVLGLLAICLILVMVLSLTGCGSKKTTSSNKTSAPQQEEPRFDPKWQLGQRKSLLGAKIKDEIKWVKLDPSTGQFVPAQEAGDVSSWVPKVRPAGKKWRIGYVNGAENYDFGVTSGNSVAKALGAAGVEFVRLDNNYPDSQKPFDNADILINKKVDLVLELIIESPLWPAVMKKYSDVKIPVVAIEVPAPGALFFGVDNYEAGSLAGKAGVDYVKSHNWDPKETALVIIEALAVGEVPLQRPMGFRDTVLNNLKDLPLKNVFEIPGDVTAQKGLESMSTFLTAHPNFKHYLVIGVDDGEATGAATALANAGRADDSAVYGMTGSATGVAALRKPAPNAFKGTVAFFPENYGKVIIPMALDLLEGKAVPEEVHYPLVVIDQNNVNQYFPK